MSVSATFRAAQDLLKATQSLAQPLCSQNSQGAVDSSLPGVDTLLETPSLTRVPTGVLEDCQTDWASHEHVLRDSA